MNSKTLVIELLRKNGRMSRYQLAKAVGIGDRMLRESIADINASDGKYEDVLIIGTSDKRGYKIADCEADYKHFIQERRKRADMTLLPVNKAERMLREID